MQQVLWTGCEERALNVIKEHLKDRSPVIDTTNKILYIKDSRENPDTHQTENILRKISTTVDNVNITLDENGNVALKDNISLGSLTVQPSETAPADYGNILLGSVGPNKSILLLTKVSDEIGTISGDIIEIGDNVNSAYHVSVSNTGSRNLVGCSTGEKAIFCQIEDNDGDMWFGLKFPEDDVANIYFHGYDTRPSENMPPIEYNDSNFKVITDVNSNSNSTSTVIETDIYGSWDFTSVPSGFTQNSGNDGFDFGNGLVLRTGHNTNIDTGNTRNGPNGNNTGFLQVASSMRISQSNYIELTIPKGQTALIYFTTTSSSSSRDVSLYDPKTETTLITVTNSNMNTYSVLSYKNETDKFQTVYICTEGGAVRFYYISNYDTTSSGNLVDVITGNIENLTPTGEDGDPHIIKLRNLTLTLSDLNNLAASCEDSDYQITLDLSECTVANDARVWNTPIFADCNGLNTFYMPQGVTAIRHNVFAGCSFLENVYLNPELAEIAGVGYSDSQPGVFNGTRIRTLEFINNNIKLGGYWASGSALRHVIFPEGFTYTNGNNSYGFILQNDGDKWLNNVPKYMKLCFQENITRQLKTDSNPWWFTAWGDGTAYTYVYYGVDNKGNYLLAPWNEVGSWDMANGPVMWGETVLFPAK